MVLLLEGVLELASLQEAQSGCICISVGLSVLVFHILYFLPGTAMCIVYLLLCGLLERASLQEAQTGRGEETSAPAGRLLRRKHLAMAFKEETSKLLRGKHRSF